MDRKYKVLSTTVPVLLVFSAGAAFGIPSQTNVTQSNAAYTIASGDFLETAGATIGGTGNFTQEGIQGLASVNDGIYGAQGGANANPGLGAFSGGNGEVLTISFPQSSGVTLNTIVSTAAWDGARASQAFQFEYQSILAPGVWQRVATVVHDPGQLPGNTNTQVTLADSTGTLAANVSQVRFNYGNTNFWGWNGYREIDATGAASAAPVGVKVLSSIQLGQTFTPSSSDLLQTGSIVTTSSGNFNDETSLGLSALTNGAFGPGGGGANGQGSSASGNAGESVTYSLDLTASPGGYSISGIDVYAGWDGFRAGQNYTASYSLVSDPGTFITLSLVDLDANANNAPGGDISTRSMLRDADGELATGVAAVRISFGDVTFGYAGYREIDVFGTAVPEPATLGLAFAGLGLALRRRKR
jgi:hypothetical protein